MPNLNELRKWFQKAVEAGQDWRDNAKVCTDFFNGDQWDDSDRKSLQDKQRPCLTINRVRPMVNVVTGYQTLNRYEPDFLPRTADDAEKVRLAKAMQKWIDDKTNFATVESDVFKDVCVTGRGFYWYEWQVVNEKTGKIKISRENPLHIYIDAESVEPDASDAGHVFRARWEDRDKIKQVYPEWKDEIDELAKGYDEAEAADLDQKLYWEGIGKKLRVVECWYKEGGYTTYYDTGMGMFSEKQIPAEFADIVKDTETLKQLGVKRIRIPEIKIKFCVFIGTLELESGESPYEHGMFPLVKQKGYSYQGVDAGIVRDMIDLQREVNKRRSQMLHILNTDTNRGWIVQKGMLDPEQKAILRKHGATPGVIIEENSPGALRRMETPQVPMALVTAEGMAKEDLRSVTGINEEMLGTDVASSASGKAIELRQRQALTQIAVLFEGIRQAREQGLFILWGKDGNKGLVQQYITEPMALRIVQDNGTEQFAMLNQPQQVIDPMTGMVQQVLNDLSMFEFDVAVSSAPATPSTRIANFYALIEAAKVGIAVPPDILLEFMDIPGKDNIKTRMIEQQQIAQQQEMARQQASHQSAGSQMREQAQMTPGAM